MKRKRLYIILAIILVALLAAAVLRELTNRLRFSVVSINLQPNTPISVVQPIDITLNKAVNQQTLDGCTTEFSPEIQNALSFSENTIRITAQPYFQPETDYAFSIQCADFGFQASFTTLSLAETPEADIGTLQTIRDFQVARETERAYTEKPWLASMPLISDTYQAMYSDADQVYYVILTLPPDGSITRQDAETELKKRLAEIGAPDLPFVYR